MAYPACAIDVNITMQPAGICTIIGINILPPSSYVKNGYIMTLVARGAKLTDPINCVTEAVDR